MSDFRTRLLVAVAGVLALAAGLGALNRLQAGGRAAGGSAATSPPARGVAQIGGKTYVDGREVQIPDPGKPRIVDTSPAPLPSKLPDFMRVQRDYYEECTLERGSPCRILFEGSVFLGSAERGRILLHAYENGSDRPAATRVLEPATKGRNILCSWEQCPYGGAWLDYTPSPDARSVTFVCELQDSSGKTLLRRDVQMLPIRS